MELEQYDLNGLTILWQASIRNQVLRTAIENELQVRILANKNFSREYLFIVCKVKNHAITVSFIPTSEAYNSYGQHITIDILLDDTEMTEMINNYSSKPPINTAGQIKAKPLVTDGLTDEQIDRLINVGFHTSEILETLHL